MFDSIKRRELLTKSGVLAMGILGLPAWMPRVALRSERVSSPNDILVVVFLRGGADGLNMVVPYGDRDYYAQRKILAVGAPKSPSLKLKDSGATDLDGFFGLHPKLAPLKELWDERVLAAVHAVGSPDPTRSHFDAMDYMERGTPGEKSMQTGWIGRHLQLKSSDNKSPFRSVGLGAIVQQSLRGPVSTIALQSIADFHLRGDTTELARIQETISLLYQGDEFVEVEGQGALAAMAQLAKIAGQPYSPANGVQYPAVAFGQSLRTLAQLIKSDLGVEVAAVDIGGWDTHRAQGGGDGQMAHLLQDFSEGLKAFYTDLHDYMNRITIVTMSEFGRRVQENSSGGTDHGHGGVMFVLGGGVNGGRVYGEWPTLAHERLAGPGDLAITTDFRDVLGEIVQRRLGNRNLAAVFPNYPMFHFRGILRDNGTAMWNKPQSSELVRAA